ncbi:MAG: hypothetical protein M3Z17_06605 [Gemmatimonadota bacterium]|nr:hypothetical protein [Gemmatimonadota bacterium]
MMTEAMKVNRFRRALAVAGALAVCACASKTQQYSGPYGKQVGDAVPKIEQAVGLKFKHPPKVETRTKAEVRAFLLKEFSDTAQLRELAGQELAYKRFGLIPDTLNLRKLLVDLLEEQIVGFYDPKTKVLYIVNGSPAEVVAVTVTHELVHALQDQYISLDSIQKMEGDNDRESAAQAVFEGQAVYEQIAVMLGNNNAAFNLPGGWDRVREMIRDNQSSMPIFASAPPLIQETLIFPYLSGAEFVRNYIERRRGSVIYDDMPTSTEQILHPSAFFLKRDAPTAINLGKLANATMVYENDLGEFETRLLLFQFLQNQDDAVRGAMGWDGDRYAVVNTPKGQGIVWLSVWDSPTEAGEFYDLLGDAIAKRFSVKASAGAAGSKTYSANGRTVQITTFEVGGRPAVSYVDVPGGASTAIIQPTQIRLTRQAADTAK